MRNAFVAIALCFLVAPMRGHAQQLREILQEVPSARAQRLEEYNSIFLRKQTYFASRYRIVRVDVDELMRQRDVTFTPFDDVEPIRLVFDELERNGEDVVFWKGRYENDPLFEATGIPFKVSFTILAWDLTELGEAVISAQNRFEHSPIWRIDESGNPVLEPGAVTTSPPPQTPQDIARHRRLLSLEKQAFFSVSAVLDVPTASSKYVLEPLKYTPRYSVVYEIDRSTLVPFRIDDPLGTAESSMSGAEREILQRYRALVDALPEDENKQIRGDIE